MQIALFIPIFCFEEFFEGLHYSELEGNLQSYTDEGHEHPFPEREKSFFRYCLGKSMDIAFVLIRSWDEFDFDVLEGKHSDDLTPSWCTSSQRIFEDLNSTCHK